MTDSPTEDGPILSLSRKKLQGIVITTAAGERIRIVVLGMGVNKVQLGFDAAPSIVIDRDEVHEAKLAASTVGDQ